MRAVRVFMQLDSLPEAYRTLMSEAESASNFFSSYAWLQTLHAHSLGAEHSLRLYGLEKNGQPLLLLPLCFNSHQRSVFQAPALLAASNYYSSLFSLIRASEPAATQDELNFLLHHIAQEVPRWGSLDLHPLALEARQLPTMEIACRAAGMAVQRYFCFGNWYLKLNGRSFPEYFESLPSRLKNTLKKKQKQASKNHNLQFKLVQTPAQLVTAQAAYEQVYRASWKPSEAQPEFIAALMLLCAQQGSLRLGLAYLDGQPVAAQLWIVHQASALIYKLAYDERHAQLSIGSLLTCHMMQQVIDVDRVSEVDYLTGDDAYKQDWMSDRRERWGLRAYNLRSPASVLAAAWHLGRQQLKRQLQRAAAIFKT
ncbi:GNAT family N-acetyltransferase [Undibacterium parvum]|uniref:GNAT family N-acetyltransferase n=1 Tax=Undibacterium parvum TaxID=401471 RepID=A0A3S9HJX0_9BURK|nr:GNAT family N-acetyltransferase [Undibacterium parvum]AZP12402.1 GNAT family N-acetyltransferase [Undibacterium parvum]